MQVIGKETPGVIQEETIVAGWEGFDRSVNGYNSEIYIRNNLNVSIHVFSPTGEPLDVIAPAPKQAERGSGQHHAYMTRPYENTVEIHYRVCVGSRKNAQQKKLIVELTEGNFCNGPLYIEECGLYLCLPTQLKEVGNIATILSDRYTRPRMMGDRPELPFIIYHNARALQRPDVVAYAHLGCGVISRIPVVATPALPAESVRVSWNYAIENLDTPGIPITDSVIIDYPWGALRDDPEGGIMLSNLGTLVFSFDFYVLNRYIERHFHSEAITMADVERARESGDQGELYKETLDRHVRAATYAIQAKLDAAEQRADMAEALAKAVGKDITMTQNYLKTYDTYVRFRTDLDTYARRQMEEEEAREARDHRERTKHRVWFVTAIGSMVSALREPTRLLIGFLARHAPNFIRATGLSPI